jgi:hypothetical protein
MPLTAAAMRFIARQPIARVERLDPCSQLALLAPKPSKAALAGSELGQELLHECGKGSLPFGSLDPGAPVGLVVH